MKKARKSEKSVKKNSQAQEIDLSAIDVDALELEADKLL